MLNYTDKHKIDYNKLAEKAIAIETHIKSDPFSLPVVEILFRFNDDYGKLMQDCLMDDDDPIVTDNIKHDQFDLVCRYCSKRERITLDIAPIKDAVASYGWRLDYFGGGYLPVCPDCRTKHKQ